MGPRPFLIDVQTSKNTSWKNQMVPMGPMEPIVWLSGMSQCPDAVAERASQKR